jgi:hypothetical protein
MPKIESEKAAKAGHVLFRYMRARQRFAENVDDPLPAHELAALLAKGKTEFDEVYVDPDARPPIILDGKANDVFDAIINKRRRALPFWEPELLAAWRHYVISDGPLPPRPATRGQASIASGAGDKSASFTLDDG